jgi:RND family efflux transporter MFP subunit
VDIFEKDLPHTKLGQSVTVRVSAYPDRTFSGKIFYIGDTVSDDTKTLCVRARINNPDLKLKPGMFAETNIVIGKKQDALVVPREAILVEENQKIVFVVEDADFHRRFVTTGIETDKYVEITSGLSAEAVVVTSGHYQLLSKANAAGTDPHAGHIH